jgi:hypothetical protein
MHVLYDGLMMLCPMDGEGSPNAGNSSHETPPRLLPVAGAGHLYSPGLDIVPATTASCFVFPQSESSDLLDSGGTRD